MRKERKCKSQRLWRHRECGGKKKKKQERASCWILHYSPLFICFMQTQALWLSSSLSSPVVYELVVFWWISLVKHCFSLYETIWRRDPFEALLTLLGFISVFFSVFCGHYAVSHRFSFRSLGLPLSPSRTLRRVWKPAREQLHRAAECAGSAPARPHSTRAHTIRPRQSARSKSGGTSTCFTATSKSLVTPQNVYNPICQKMNMQYRNTHTHWYLTTANNFMHSNKNGNRIKMETNLLFVRETFFSC